MSWHKLWHQRDDAARPEAPSSKLRRAMRKQMRDNARRIVPTPTHRPYPLRREIDEPPAGRLDRCDKLPDDLYKPKGWYLA